VVLAEVICHIPTSSDMPSTSTVFWASGAGAMRSSVAPVSDTPSVRSMPPARADCPVPEGPTNSGVEITLERDARSKRPFGQYFTIGNPFAHPAFAAWWQDAHRGSPVLEPFAGGDNIPTLLKASGYLAATTRASTSTRRRRPSENGTR
jgi:hypothetical protein